MSTSNKTKPSAKDNPTDPFKRAVTGCLRAIARKPDLEVDQALDVVHDLRRQLSRACLPMVGGDTRIGGFHSY